jgi:hypothetical protein
MMDREGSLLDDISVAAHLNLLEKERFRFRESQKDSERSRKIQKERFRKSCVVWRTSQIMDREGSLLDDTSVAAHLLRIRDDTGAPLSPQMIKVTHPS